MFPFFSSRNTRSYDRFQEDDSLQFESLEHRRVLAHLFVTTTADVVDPHDNVISLREAIGVANQNGETDVIGFARQARHGTIVLDPTLGELDISDDVTIRGNGQRKVTVSGGQQVRVFHVYPEVEATFRGISIDDGLAFDAPGFIVPDFAFGGGIYNEGGTVHMKHVSMSNNQAGIYDAQGIPVFPVSAGGAIANEFGGVLTVDHGSFYNNHAVGLLTGVGGAITSDRGDSSFGTGNPPAPSDAPMVEISHSRFVGNTAFNQFGPTPALPLLSGFALGGGIFSLAGSLDVAHSHFHNNQAIAGQENVDGPSIGRGGAIFVMDFSPFGPGEATLEVNHSRFSHNSAHGGDSSTGVGGEATGGAIAGIEGAEISVHHSRFYGNLAHGGQGVTQGGNGIGGAIGLDVFAGLVPNPFPSLLVTGSKFASNQAIGGDGPLGGFGRGGAVGVNGGSTADIQRSYLAHNRAIGGAGGGNGQGGGVYNAAGSTTVISRSFVMANHAIGGSGGGVGQGGGLFNELSTSGGIDGVFIIDNFTMHFTRFNTADEGPNFFGF